MSKPTPKPKKKAALDALFANLPAPVARDSAGAERAHLLAQGASRQRTMSAANPLTAGPRISTAIRPDAPHPTDIPANLGQMGDRVANAASFVPGGQVPAGLWMMGRGAAHGNPMEGLMGGLVASLPIKAPEGFWANLGERASMVNGGARVAGPATADMMPSLAQLERRGLVSQGRRWLAEVIDPAVKADRRALVTDELTGLGNRRAFEQARPSIDADPNMSWISLDAQRLKAINTQYGQLGGDALLRRSGDAVHAALKDIPGARGFHVSGDEFAIAVPKGMEQMVMERASGARIPVHADGRLGSAGLVGHVGDTYAAADKGLQGAKAAAKAAEPLTPALDFLRSRAAPVRYPTAGRPGGTHFATPRASEAGGASLPTPTGVTLPEVGGDPTKLTDKMAKLRDTPEQVKARLADARAKLEAPLVPWVPNPRGFVDRNLIHPDIGITPAGAEPLFPRPRPLTDRAAMGQFEGIASPDNINIIADQIRRGQHLGGRTFYPSYGAVEADLAGRGMDPRVLLDATSAGSIQRGVPAELTNATVINWGLQRGMFDAQSLKGLTQDQYKALATQLREAIKREFPDVAGLPLMGTHLQSYGKLATDEAPSALKIPTYRGHKGSVLNPNQGNVAGEVLDTHTSKGETLASPFHSWFAGNKGFSAAEYGVQEDVGRQVARGMGISDRNAQASRWVGGGDITGLDTPPKDYAQIYEDLVAWNADKQGLAPGKLRDNIAKGNGILFPDYGRANLIP